MARKKLRATLVDHLVAAIEPALIMVMVGGLMFFLLDVWYDGPVLERMRYILFWFIFGIVLITRVSMEIGGEQAKGYGVMLGGAVALVITVLGGFQPFALLAMGVAWWATHKLTYDCTLLDEDQDTGVGLLMESGLDSRPQGDTGDEAVAAGGSRDEALDDPEAMDTSLMPDRPGWSFWKKDEGGKQRPHAPGVWLIYFTIAAIPLFGLGQWLVPSVQEDRRTWLSFYFLAYLASGMGLLLSTSFLNLRRYLRRRKLKMPAAMTATWLTTGAILIAVLTLAAALLPVPLSRLGAARGSSANGDGLSASRYAMLKDSGVQGDGAQSEGQAASKAGDAPKSEGKPEGSGETNDPNASRQTNGRGREGGSGGRGEAKSGAPRGKPGASQGGQQGKNGGANDQAGERSKGGNRSAEQVKGDGRAKAQGGRSDERAEGKAQSNAGDEKGGSQQGEKSSSDGQNSGSPPSRGITPPTLPQIGLDWLRTPIMAAGIAVVIYGLIRYWRDLVQVIQSLIAAILAVFGFGWRPKAEVGGDRDEEEAVPPPRPFSSYSNPFDSGLVHQLSPDALVVYSFEALEAWAYEREMAREPHETPLEFVNRVGQARPELGRDASRMVGYFVALVYGQRGFRDEILAPLEDFWRALEASTWSAPAASEIS